MNPFSALPASACDTLDLPTIPTCQLGTAYGRMPTQVKALIFVRPNGNRPSDWSSANGWADVVNNSSTSADYGRYMAGIGSFLPVETTKANLSGGRHELNRERVYQLRFRSLNTTANGSGHVSMLRQIENNFREYDIWIETIGGRIIGGENGLRPISADAAMPFAEAAESREYVDFTFNFTFYQFPDTAIVDVNFLSQSYFWGDPSGEAWGDGASEGWGWGG